LNDYQDIPYINTHQWAPQKPRRVWLNILLFLITIITTMMTGASFQGFSWAAQFENPALIFNGWSYSFVVLLILTTHEFGHYFASLRHRINVTLPFYIPLPIPDLFHFGTMGAFIRIKSPIPHRTALMDVAVAGPLAGFVFSLIFLTFGYLTLPSAEQIMAHVDIVHQRLGITPEMVKEAAATLTLGKSTLIWFFNDVIGQGKVPMSEIYHFPFIFAGWVGLLVTALNLLPIGQLDGGHVVYALFGYRAKNLSRIAYGALAGLTVILYYFRGSEATVWVPWMIILAIIGLRHPPTLRDEIEIDQTRRWLGWLCIAIFFLSFIPLPFHLS